MKSKYIIILIIAALILLFGCQAGEKTIPNELFGVWETSEPKYSDCFFEIRKGSIIFANTSPSELNIDSNIISKIEMALEEGKTLYTIHYKKTGEEKYEFSFYYYPHEGGSIRFKNQIDIEWVKTDIQSIDELFTG